MNETPPPLPHAALPQNKPSALAPWLCWIGASTVLPALPFLLLGKEALDNPGCLVLVLFALAVQLGCSIWVPIVWAKRRLLGVGFVIAMSIVLMMGSVAVGSASFFGACVVASPRMDFR